MAERARNGVYGLVIAVHRGFDLARIINRTTISNIFSNLK